MGLKSGGSLARISAQMKKALAEAGSETWLKDFVEACAKAKDSEEKKKREGWSSWPTALNIIEALAQAGREWGNARVWRQAGRRAPVVEVKEQEAIQAIRVWKEAGCWNPKRERKEKGAVCSALENRWPGLADWLLDEGFDPNDYDPLGAMVCSPALSLALSGSKKELALKMMRLGAKPTGKRKHEIHLAGGWGAPSPMAAAALAGSQELLDALLEANWGAWEQEKKKEAQRAKDEMKERVKGMSLVSSSMSRSAEGLRDTALGLALMDAALEAWELKRSVGPAQALGEKSLLPRL